MSLWVKLVQIGGIATRDAWIFLFLTTAHMASVALPVERDSDLHWRLRLFTSPLLMNFTYFVLKSAVPTIHPKLEDRALQTIDQWVFGDNLSLRLEGWVHPILTEYLSLCYLWYLPYLFASQIKYLLGDLRVLKKFYAGLFSIYAVGYFGYSTMPALGPHLAMADQFATPLEGGWITVFTRDLVLTASNRVDIFPSLHVANSLYILLFDFRHQPRRFWLCLAPFAGLCFSTVYLRYHYTIDVICGAALALLALWLSKRSVVEKKGGKGGEVVNRRT